MKDFSSSRLHPGIIQALKEQHITKPSDIQAQCIPVLLEHNGDFVGRSATGTGKTYAFGAPLLSRIHCESGQVQAVVLVPTRELCEQVAQALSYLGKYLPGLKIEAIYGGVSLKAQKKALGQGVQILVATPGRLTDMIDRQLIHLSKLDFIIFDEADEMLLKGFQKDLDRILASTQRKYSTWLFSATMPNEIEKLVKKYLHKTLKKITIGQAQRTNSDIAHWAVELKAEDKLNVLLHYLAQFDKQQGIVFCRTKSGVQKLYKQLSAIKFPCGAIHGDLPQGLRNKVMDQFRQGHIPLLLATDVAARGVDIPSVSFVIQYHIAETPESYTHRSGRSARTGNKGVSLTFVFPEEQEKLSALNDLLDLHIERKPIPSQKDQLIRNAILWGKKVAKEKPVGDKLDSANTEAFKATLSHLSKDELLEKMLAAYLREHQGT